MRDDGALHNKPAFTASREIAGKTQMNIGKVQRKVGEAVDEVRDATGKVS